MVEDRSTDEYKERVYGCTYCCAVGACPRCHGRAGYDRLQREVNIMNARVLVDAQAYERDQYLIAQLRKQLREMRTALSNLWAWSQQTQFTHETREDMKRILNEEPT